MNTIAGFGGVDALLSADGAVAHGALQRAGKRSGTSTCRERCRWWSRACASGFFLCFASVLGGETLSSAAGVGYAIAHAGELLESPRMYAWIVLVLATTIVLNVLVSRLGAKPRVYCTA